MSVFSWPSELVLLDASGEAAPGNAGVNQYMGTGEIHPQADHYLRVRWYEGQFEDYCIGAGRYGVAERVRLDCELWSQLNTDDPNQASDWLTDASLGHAQLRHKIVDALAIFQPSDAAGNWLVIEPITPRSSRRPRRPRDGDGWGASGVDFSVFYLLALTNTYQ